MPDEDDFLHALRSSPGDDATRLVFADWLDDQGDPGSLEKASYLRAEHRLAGLPEADPARDEVLRQLRELASRLPAQWKVAVARVPLENCEVAFRFVCPQRWDQLRETHLTYVRFCSACAQSVYFCDTIDEARERARGGACVAIDLRVRRESGDLDVAVVEDDDLLMGDLDDDLDDLDFGDEDPR